MTELEQKYLNNLEQRALWMTKRAAAKKEMGWEYQYDETQRDALLWALGIIHDRSEDQKLD